MISKKHLLTGVAALAAAGLAAQAAPAYPVDPGGDRLVTPMTSRTSAGAGSPTSSHPGRPNPRPKPPIEP
jgi:hypothetical protein